MNFVANKRCLLKTLEIQFLQSSVRTGLRRGENPPGAFCFSSPHHATVSRDFDYVYKMTPILPHALKVKLYQEWGSFSKTIYVSSGHILVGYFYSKLAKSMEYVPKSQVIILNNVHQERSHFMTQGWFTIHVWSNSSQRLFCDGRSHPWLCQFHGCPCGGCACVFFLGLVMDKHTIQIPFNIDFQKFFAVFGK